MHTLILILSFCAEVVWISLGVLVGILILVGCIFAARKAMQARRTEYDSLLYAHPEEIEYEDD